MPRDTAGNYTLPLGNPVIDGTIIETTWANPTMEDIAVQLNNVYTRDGKLGPLSPFLVLDGTVSIPGLAFVNSPTTGLWYAAASAGYSYGGGAVWTAAAGQITFNVPPLYNSDPGTANTLVRKQYVDNQVAAYLPLAGGTLTGDLLINKAGKSTSSVWSSNGNIAELNLKSVGVSEWSMYTGAGATYLGFASAGTPCGFLSEVGRLNLQGATAGLAVDSNTEDGSDQITLVNRVAGGVAQGFMAMAGAGVYLGNHRVDGGLYLYAGGASRLAISSAGAASFTGNVSAPTFIGALNGNAGTATQAVNATNVNGPSGTVNTGTLTVQGNAGVNGTLGVTGNTSLSALNVSGSAVIVGNVSAANLTTGTYTPTFSVSSVLPTANPCNWMRVGDMVTVTGYANTTNMASSLSCQMSLPVASDLQQIYDLTGTANYTAPAASGAPLSVVANTTTNTATFNTGGTAPSGSATIYFMFMYKVR